MKEKKRSKDGTEQCVHFVIKSSLNPIREESMWSLSTRTKSLNVKNVRNCSNVNNLLTIIRYQNILQIFSLSHSCNICNKSFIAKVTLDSHIKYKHSDDRLFECKKCDSKFKQKKNLDRHIKNAHGLNPRKEDYWQDFKRSTFDCKNCKNSSEKKFWKCIKRKCPNSYKYKKNLYQHKL